VAELAINSVLKRLSPVWVGLAMIALAACSAPGQAPSNGTAQGEPAAAGEAPAVPYADSRFHYRIDAPGQMTSNADGSASFIGPSERLEIKVVQGSQASDPTALAGKDATTLPSSLSGFRKLAAPSPINLNGLRAVKFIYAWSAGASAVTGKPTDLTTVRYYIPKDATTVAVVTYSIVTNQYDPEGADDLAKTFRWQ
jgi:hypothetical protein